MKKLIILTLTIQACSMGNKDFVIHNKSVILSNPHFSTYSFRIGSIGYVESIQFIDSTNKYQIGDILIQSND